MPTGIPDSSIQTMNEEAFHWDWKGVFNPTTNHIYGFEARANLDLGRQHGRGRLYSVPTREYDIGSLLDAWINVPRCLGEMIVKEDNEPNRQAVMSFIDPVFTNLNLRKDGLPHASAHNGRYRSGIEMRWELGASEEDTSVSDKLYRGRFFTPRSMMVSSTAKTVSVGYEVEGSVWMWGNDENETWRPEHGAQELRFSVEGPTSLDASSPHAFQHLPEWTTPYVQSVVSHAMELQQHRDGLLLT